MLQKLVHMMVMLLKIMAIVINKPTGIPVQSGTKSLKHYRHIKEYKIF